MDTVNIVSEFTRKIFSRLAESFLRKKLGCEIGVQLKELSITICDSKAQIHLDADAELEKEEIIRLLKQAGLDGNEPG